MNREIHAKKKKSLLQDQIQLGIRAETSISQ